MTIAVTDNEGGIGWWAFSLTVNNVNDAPFFDENFYILTDTYNGVFDALPSIVVDQDDPFYFHIRVTDIDLLVTDEILTFNALAKPDFLFLSNSVSGVQDWLPDDTASTYMAGLPTNEDVGSHIVAFEVTDGEGATDQKTFTFTVNNVNDSPVFDFTPPTKLTKTHRLVTS